MPFVLAATVLSAVIAAVAVIVAQRPHADIVRQASEALERGHPERIWRPSRRQCDARDAKSVSRWSSPRWRPRLRAGRRTGRGRRAVAGPTATAAGRRPGPARRRRPWRGRTRPPRSPDRTGPATRPRRRWRAGGRCGCRRAISSGRGWPTNTVKISSIPSTASAGGIGATGRPTGLLGVDTMDRGLLGHPAALYPPAGGPARRCRRAGPGRRPHGGRRPRRRGWPGTSRGPRGGLGQHPVGPRRALHRPGLEDDAGAGRGRGRRGAAASPCPTPAPPAPAPRGPAAAPQRGPSRSTIPAQSKVTVVDRTVRRAWSRSRLRPSGPGGSGRRRPRRDRRPASRR